VSARVLSEIFVPYNYFSYCFNRFKK